MAAAHIADMTADLIECGDLDRIRSLLSDQTISAVYIRTESDVYGVQPAGRHIATLIDTRPGYPSDPGFADRLNAALDKVGHQSKPAFRERLVKADLDGFADRLNAALDRIGHQGKPAFRASLVKADAEVAS